MELDGQVAIVTGAARGIGFAISQRLKELGARVACWDIAPPAKENGSVFAHAEIVNVTNLASVEAGLERTLATLGQADILVNNAGVLTNAVAPAMAETELLVEMTEDYIADVKSRMPMGRLANVTEIADTVAWIASPRCSFTSGQVFDVTGGRATY
jgi:NAD(P)-dependent dehydrogenase (short-subunit alcohol dehydrogenase family)